MQAELIPHVPARAPVLPYADSTVLRPDFSPAQLYVIVVVSNPVQWQSRIRLAREFLQRLRTEGVSIILVEHAFGDRPHALATEQVSLYLPLRGYDLSELWLKEGLMRYAVARLPHGAEYFAWIDADTSFAKPGWALATLHALQHWPVLQPFSVCMDLGPDHTPIADEKGLKTTESFGKAWLEGKFSQYDTRPDATKWGWTGYFSAHVGYAWAMRRSAYEGIGGFIDWIPTGAADWQMAMGFAGRITNNPKRSDAFNKHLRVFQQRADRVIKQSIGCVDGLLLHYHHGPKAKRGYVDRDEMLWKTGFDPDVDLVRDAQGILVFTGENRVFRDFLRSYLRSRNEDSVEV